MDIAQILFWFLSALALLGAIGVIASKNPIYSVLCLIIVFFAISGHYILMNAQFLGIVNIIVYAGAIMVLFLFVIMLLDLKVEERRKIKKFGAIAGLVSVGAIFAIFLKSLSVSHLAGNSVLTTEGSTIELGKLLFSQYLLPFEIVSVLLLVAMISVILLSKKDLK